MKHRLSTTAALLVLSLALSGCGLFKRGKAKDATIGQRVAVLNFEDEVTAEPDVAELAVVVPPPVANATWDQPGGNAAKSLGHLALPETLSRAWSISVGEGSSATRRLNATPVIADGRLYTIDVGATVRAFDAKSGAPIWSATVEREGEDSRPAFGGGVSVMGGRVFATTGYGVAAAFDAVTGAKQWERRLAAPLRGAPAVSGDRVFVTTQDNQISALNAATGEVVWEANGTVEQSAILGPGAPAVAAGTVVAGFSSGELFALRVENGRTVWQDALARSARTTALAALADIAASPVIDAGRVYAIGHGGRMAAIEISTGQRVWERNFAGTQTPWVAGDFLFAVSLDGELVCLTRDAGKVRWVRQLRRWRDEEDKQGPISWAGPVLASDRLVLVSSRGRMVTVSPYTGEMLSEVDLGQPAYLPPVVADNTLYVLTDDGKLGAWR